MNTENEYTDMAYTSPVIYTARLIMRPVSPDDAELLFRLRTDPVVNEYVPVIPPKNIDEMHALINTLMTNTNTRKSDFWIIISKETGEAIGSITLWNYNLPQKKAEIGFVSSVEHWGKGYMTEAANAVIDFGKHTMQFTRIEGWAHKENLGSLKVLQKLGCVRDLEAESAIDRESVEKDFQIWVV